MPVRRNPNSLKNNALHAITLNFEMLCYGTTYSKGTKDLANYIHTEGYKKICGPFVDWPSSMLQDIIAALYRDRCGHQHLLHCVIQPQLTRCAILQHGSMHQAMILISERCGKSLKHLEINHSKNVPTGFYGAFFKKLNNLTNLSIYDSMVDDHDFRSIGECMPNLVELNAGRTWITNNGIKHLCLDDEQQAGKMKPIYRCPRLVVLNVTQTRVSPEGLAIFVACHPNVVRIDHEESFHALSFVRRQVEHTQKNMFPQKKEENFNCSLSVLAATSVHLNSDEFAFAVESCPLAEEIIVLSAGLIDDDLYRLMNLSRLTRLHLGNKNATCLNFYQGVAPVLTACGQTLKKIVLEDFTEIDIQQIGISCPKLEHLALSGTTTYAPVAQITPGLFRQLHKLELWNRNNRWGSPDIFQYSICSNTLKQLLLFSKIDFLLLYKVDTMTDELFREIWSHNPMKNLNNVIFDHCQAITSATIWRLLEMPNELSVLRCWHCGGVPSKTKDEIKNVIKDENLTLYWEWYPLVENEDEIAAMMAAAELEDDWEED